MQDSRCSICSDAAAQIAVGELAGQGASTRDIAARIRKSKSAVGRHIRHTEARKKGEQLRGTVAQGSVRRTSHAGRKRDAGNADRCPSCGLLAAAADPQSLMRRAEKFLSYAETIIMRAQEDNDSRLALQGIDRGNKALETLMKANGMLQSDSTVNVNIDARKQGLAILGKLDEATIRRAIADPNAIGRILEAASGATEALP